MSLSSFSRIPFAFVGVVLVVTACAGAGAGTGGSEEGAAAAAADADRLEAIYRARIEGARMNFTEADVRFMSGMIPHHAQAIAMAELAPANDASGPIRTLAARIINAQKDEIALMQQWLRDRDQPVPAAHTAGADPGGEAEHAMDMPGMLSPGQMRELDRARGQDFDRLFLELMIRHHQGAVDMVHELFASDGAGQAPEVFRFASDVQVDQVTEIARMERMLSAFPTPGEANHDRFHSTPDRQLQRDPILIPLKEEAENDR